VAIANFGVGLDGTLQERNGRREIGSRGQHPRGRAVGLQRVERWCRRLFERPIVLADRGERFADAGSESTRHLAQRIQNVFLSRGLHLFLIENVASAAVLRAQPQDILASEAGNRAIEHGTAGGSLAQAFGKLRREPCIRRLAHQAQYSLNTLFRNETEKRRLLGYAASHCRSVPSNTGSPVVFVKSARTMVSFCP
jgi:hypothetical protein